MDYFLRNSIYGYIINIFIVSYFHICVLYLLHFPMSPSEIHGFPLYYCFKYTYINMYTNTIL